MTKIIPVRPDANETELSSDRRGPLGRRQFGMRFPSRRTFGGKYPSRRTFGGKFPSRRTLG